VSWLAIARRLPASKWGLAEETNAGQWASFRFADTAGLREMSRNHVIDVSMMAIFFNGRINYLSIYHGQIHLL
jgi:hypothetical protein